MGTLFLFDAFWMIVSHTFSPSTLTPAWSAGIARAEPRMTQQGRRQASRAGPPPDRHPGRPNRLLDSVTGRL